MILLRSLSIPAFKQLRHVELQFPRAGGVLIEGPNESGKSTLFEAIYFALYGAPLVGENGQPALSSLVPHGGESAAVTLTLLADGATLEIQRSVNRSLNGSVSRRPPHPAHSVGAGLVSPGEVRHDARLIVRRPGAAPEEVAGPGPVTERILRALGGLDGDALRNSCFMEQGALDRVEALSHSSREDAIARLLGLERLVGIERDLKPTHDDHAELERARIELAVAERDRAATDAAMREAEATAELRAARVRSLVEQRDAVTAEHAQRDQTAGAMRDRERELDGHIARAAQITALVAALEATEPELAAGREAEAEAATHRARLADLDRVEREELPAAESRLAELRTLEGELAAADEARAELQRAEQMQRVAELDARLAQLDRLMPALAAHESAQRELALTQEALRLARAESSGQTAVAEHQGAYERADAEARVAQQAVDRANVRDILAYWVRLKEIEALKRGEHQIVELTAQRDALATKVTRLHRREVWTSVFAMAGALVALGTALAGLNARDYRYFVATAVAFVDVWVSFGVFVGALLGGRRADKALRETERRLTLASIRSEAANLLGGSIEDIPQVEADLRSAGAGIPESIEVGRARLASLTAAEPASLADLEDHARAVLLQADRSRVALTNAQSQLEAAQRERAASGLLSDAPVAEIERRVAVADRSAAGAETAARGLLIEPFTWPVERAAVQATNAELAAQRAQAARGLGIGGDELVTVEAAERAVQVAETRLQAQSSSAQARLAALGLPADASAVAAARGAAESTVARHREQLAERESLASALATHAQRAESARTELSPAARQAYQTAVGLDLFAGDAAPNGSTDPSEPQGETHADLAAVAKDRATVRAAAAAALEALDERSRRDELAGVRAQLATHGDRMAALAERRDTLHVQLAAALAEQGVNAQGDEPLSALAQGWPLLAEVGPEEVEAREQALAEASREAHFARRTADELARSHGFAPDQRAALDAAEARRRVEDAERILRQRELATSMARDVRTRLVHRVLPETEFYMRALLPELTLGRYRDVRLSRGEESPAGPDLRVQMWDEAAGRYIGKSLLSGGAQDQSSLALRLAFALATRPKELGATPGFIFLDEPLSAFDAERAQALARLLTMGMIAHEFPQVFLISHSASIDPASFRYALRLQDGTVAASNLPSPREAARMWEAEAVLARAGITNA